ncbi:DUF222 domain-containing protein [Mycobacterium sp. THU-M104]|uniref:DUF222 domain-containing protein n=1 Tax=Mycobacterium sp. THU-M104 TaxID=3410515 RepID=UPI003B9B6D09
MTVLWVSVKRRPWVTRSGLGAAVGHVVERVDRDAGRRAVKAGGDRRADDTADASGMVCQEGSLFATDGQVLERCLAELAAIICQAGRCTRERRVRAAPGFGVPGARL